MKNLFLTLCLFFTACEPSELKTDEGNVDNIEVPQSPITWSECGSTEGDHPCDFTLIDQSGNTVNLYELYGQPIVLDFSTMWCYYCQMAAYDIKEVADLNEEHDLVYITILAQNFTGADPEQIDLTQWSDHFEIGGESTPVLGASMSMIDPTGENGWLVEAWPTFYFIDREMVIKQYLRGWSAPSISAGVEAIVDQEEE
tara:strand:+ start:332 stop:928 length:597 start_codon:yes stop_codon:yes gene_type:complete